MKKETIGKANETKSQYFVKFCNIDKCLTRLRKRRRVLPVPRKEMRTSLQILQPLKDKLDNFDTSKAFWRKAAGNILFDVEN